MNLGSTEINKVYVGTTEVTSVSLGANQVWTSFAGSQPGQTFSLELVGGIGGNFAGEPQGVAYDAANDMFYPMSNNSGAREVKKINRAGTTLATNSNQGGSTQSIQDGTFAEGKVWVPRTTNGATSFIQRFDTDLNYETEFQIPSQIAWGVAVAVGPDGNWWWGSNSEGVVHRTQGPSGSFAYIDSIDIDTTAGNTYTGSPHYSGLDWYGNYMFGIDHTAGGDVDIWYWDGSTLTITQQLSQSPFDLYNGIAIDAANNKFYGSSRNLSDDLQEYNIIVN